MPEDYTEAAKWFRLAAEQGNADAQFFLGSVYDFGQGVPQNYVLAYAWYNLAAAQGEEHASTNKEILRSEHDPRPNRAGSGTERNPFRPHQHVTIVALRRSKNGSGVPLFYRVLKCS